MRWINDASSCFSICATHNDFVEGASSMLKIPPMVISQFYDCFPLSSWRESKKRKRESVDYRGDVECGICYDSTRTAPTICCNFNICDSCYSKVKRCPICRKTI